MFAEFRGTGGSGGALASAFDAQENDDIWDLIEGVASRPWCDGNVGMWGHSYGGITSLRGAAVAPPHLRAVVAIQGSTDPYLYEVMRWGALGMAMICGEFSAVMLAQNALPPISPSPTGDDADVWQGHLATLRPWHFEWLDHPLYDAYWQPRAVDSGEITVPTMVIASWRDTTLAGPFRDFASLRGPGRLISGPWEHSLPDEASIEPINATHEILRWWDRWLRGSDNGVSEEPRVQVYVQPCMGWESHETWPPASVPTTLYLHPGNSLESTPWHASELVTVPFDASVGAQSGLGMRNAALDQGDDDSRSVCFDSRAVDADLDLAGVVRVGLRVLADSSSADIAVRLSDLDEHGASALITKGFLRVANPPPYGVAERVEGDRELEIDLNPTRYRVARGHRLRLALACADFPEIWPQPHATGYRVELGRETFMVMPVLHVPSRLPPPSFQSPDPSLASSALGNTKHTYRVHRQPGDATVTVEGGAETEYDGVRGDHVKRALTYVMSTDERAPARSSLVTSMRIAIAQPGREVIAEAEMDCSPAVHSATVRVLIDGAVTFEREYRATPGAPSPAT